MHRETQGKRKIAPSHNTLCTPLHLYAVPFFVTLSHHSLPQSGLAFL